MPVMVVDQLKAVQIDNPNHHGSVISFTARDLSFQPGGSLLGRTRSLYQLSDLGGKPVFFLKIVFAKDTAAAEKELKEKFDRQYGPRQPR